MDLLPEAGRLSAREEPYSSREDLRSSGEITNVTKHRFTVEEYRKMGEAGIFSEDDRETKLPMYARTGIPEAWLVDLRHDVVEVHTDPTAQGYGAILRARPGEGVPSSVVRPQILADEILPDPGPSRPV